MPAQPTVSVVIPCFNAAATIGLQLEALRRQFDPPRFEVLVVDNGSHDDLSAAIQPYMALPEFELRTLDAGEHQGSSYARNVGIGQARAESIMFCDADDVVSRTWIRNGHRCTLTDGLWSGGSTALPSAVFRNGLDHVYAAFDAEPPSWERPLDDQLSPFPVLMGGNFGAYRATLLELGGFDQAFAHHGDDNDLGFRARRAGHRVPIAESVRIGYRGKPTLRSRMHEGFRAAQARRKILEFYGVAAEPPIPPWPNDLARTLAATVLSPLRGGRVTGTHLAMRWSFALGNAYGALKYRHLGGPPASMLGVGLGTE